MNPKRVATLVALSLPHFGQQINEHNASVLRQRGRYRELVLSLLARGGQPRPADLAAALREPQPDPSRVGILLTNTESCELMKNPPRNAGDVRAWMRSRIPEKERLERARQRIADENATLMAYVARVYVLGQARRPGRTPGTPNETRIATDYYNRIEVGRASRAQHGESERGLITKIKKRVMADFKIRSQTTLDSIIKRYRPKFF